MKIIDLFRQSAAKYPKRIVIKYNNRVVSYEQMSNHVDCLANHLRSLGCGPGVKIAIVLGNSAEYVMAFFAISAVGGTIIPLSNRMTSYEVAEYARTGNVSVVITNGSFITGLTDKLNLFACTILSIYLNADERLNIDTVTSSNNIEEKSHDDVALMVPTSGTTGKPKIVMLTGGQLISNMLVYRHLMGFENANVVYCALSFQHIYCICAQFLTHISLGDTFVLTDKPFFIKDFLRVVEEENINITAFVPYMAILLAEFFEPERYDLSSLKIVTLSGAKTPTYIYKLLSEKYTHVAFVNTYGMSEAGSRIAIAAPYAENYPVESVGKPMPGIDVRIINEQGHRLPVEKVGQILVKSSGVMKGYYNQPELTAQTIQGGWLQTRDLGRFDENGNLFLEGRVNDLIITGGKNVCPHEIEQCLIKHPSIREAVVVGLKDRLLQEVPCAFVVTNNHGQTPKKSDIIRFCRSRLSSHKVPLSVGFLEELPRLKNGKIDREKLKKMPTS